MVLSEEYGQLGRVLIVEGSEHYRKQYSRLLQEYGCDIATASSVADALELLLCEPEQYAVIMLDAELQGGKGFELLAWIKDKQSSLKSIPVILRSVENNRERIEQAIHQGAYSFLNKHAGDSLTRCLVETAYMSLYYLRNVH